MEEEQSAVGSQTRPRVEAQLSVPSCCERLQDAGVGVGGWRVLRLRFACLDSCSSSWNLSLRAWREREYLKAAAAFCVSIPSLLPSSRSTDEIIDWHQPVPSSPPSLSFILPFIRSLLQRFPRRALPVSGKLSVANVVKEKTSSRQASCSASAMSMGCYRGNQPGIHR